MEELTKTEEKIMQALWSMGKGFVKDIIERLDEEPRPPYTTISSIVRILESKGFVTHKAYGKTHEYYPAISRDEYRKSTYQRMMKQYFDNKTSSLLSFLVSEKKLSRKDIDELKKFIDQQSRS
ncbi:BlaI/MecI/CopY family transcriptional regulator [Chitinophaga cymbidii]|uniref:Transcriptional regulator n=1 Tax=Chitinophaga cymbidii TaxID=1096750 RepID=A0A512RIG6_9BACT|nr:BlaI/MecI/CopY family transcriptional regulator [Chitinophaga cymbidii]GEP95496.1 transcriptional regulator [Chitinophaga cymbidii]